MNSSTILADHPTSLPVPARCPQVHVFSVSVGSSDRSLRAWLLVLSLRVVAGRNVETTKSCGNGAVVELEEPVDRPGTTIGT